MRYVDVLLSLSFRLLLAVEYLECDPRFLMVGPLADPASTIGYFWVNFRCFVMYPLLDLGLIYYLRYYSVFPGLNLVNYPNYYPNYRGIFQYLQNFELVLSCIDSN